MSRKRKIDSECRVFNQQWTSDYLFVQCKEKAVCLICQESVAVFKEYNLRRHYESRHKDKFSFLTGQVRTDKIAKLKHELETQQNSFIKQKHLNISSVRASFQVAKLIASSGKPFTDGEFVKQCLTAVVKEMCPEKADLFSAVSLSAPTVTRRVEEMGDKLQTQTKRLCSFSLSLDESNDVRDTAQLLIFIRGTNDKFEVTEELAGLQSIKGTTTGEDIYRKVHQTVADLDLDWAKLVSVTTDGAPSMVGSMKGVIARINREMSERGHPRLIAIHCLIHQQALCCKAVKWDSVMEIVVSCVNFIRAHALNHRQFQDFLSELNADYEDVLYHTEVRWLSRGRVLKRFNDLLPEINTFMLSKNKAVPELTDEEWKWHLAFLTDVTDLLNSLNVQLQGKGRLISDMHSYVKAFEVKLGLLLKHVKEKNFCHFPTTQKRAAEVPSLGFPAEKCAEALEILQCKFQVRFQELHAHAKDIRLFQNPFAADIDCIDPIYQLELAELQNFDNLKDAFKSSTLVDFYASLPGETYPNLHTLKMTTIFGSTYICEQTFSRMKQLKCPTRSRLSDEHLHHLLRLTVTNMEPDIDSLVSQKQAHSSH
ncbi:general transcription factor II-I repeat domain-containing protein 2-like [Astyanax mexicanus]|uniref:General transcription factor II-I repeat domain-containing protein 2-like n=1 Tax=Astyanax mexicanus TaxID=7994 RepID=A0A8T2M4B7_ASTMX|nr:general transcription factor II-I repeat domain-containing protein 2-like [Astyanax mexicanus]